MTTKCNFCDKKGLPILPVRHAIARTTVKTRDAHGHWVPVNTPNLPKNFNADVRGKPLPALSDKVAKYTLRLLRSGYLYVYDERGTWTAYVVTKEGYLWESAALLSPAVPGGKHAPPSPTSTACVAKGDPYIARCFTVKDPGAASIVWVCFSDVPWTAAVLAKHNNKAWRQAHMQMIDVKAWCGGGTPKYNVGSFDLLKDPSLAHEVVADFFPGADRGEWESFSPWPLQKLASASSVTAMQNWAKRTAHPYRPGLVAVPDPVGIVREINGLALMYSNEVKGDADFQWKLQTMTFIDSIKHAVRNNAMKDVATLKSAAAYSFYLNPNADNYNPDATLNEAWEKYKSQLKKNSLETFRTQYKNKMNWLNNNAIGPLDKAYVTWLGGDTFITHFTHSYDPTDILNGTMYQQVVHACIAEASGRKGAFDHFRSCLSDDPSSPKSIIMRAMLFNNDALIKKAKAAMSAKAGKGEETPWREIGSKVFDATKDSFAGTSHGKVGKGRSHTKGSSAHAVDIAAAPFDDLSHMLHELSGPITNSLGEAVNKGVTFAVAASLPERYALAIVMSVQNATRNYKTLVIRETKASLWDANQIVARATARTHGKKVMKWVERPKDAPVTEEVTIKGVFQVETSALGTADSRAITQEEYDRLLEDTIKKALNAEVKIGIVGTILCGISLYSAAVSTSKSGWERKTNIYANIGATVGSLMETVGSVLEKTSWKDSSRTLNLTSKLEVNFGVQILKAVGKGLGAATGMAFGVLDVNEGYENLKDDYKYGAAMMFLGFGEIIAGILMITAWSGIGLVFGLVLAAGIFIAETFKRDDFQKWMEKCRFGTLHDKKDVGYDTREKEQSEFEKLQHQGA